MTPWQGTKFLFYCPRYHDSVTGNKIFILLSQIPWLRDREQNFYFTVPDTMTPWQGIKFLFYCPRYHDSVTGNKISILLSQIPRLRDREQNFYFTVPDTMTPWQGKIFLFYWPKYDDTVTGKNSLFYCPYVRGIHLLKSFEIFVVISLNKLFNSLRPSDAYMCQQTSHHWFR